ncbi:unnamed protein product [Adineta steineri]|uniref:LIM zinc-binding domain-containing protein n=1 Tax=Adineta steineri TaxID=433720 RepID=A0A818YGS7_9BILA|nr:unnamed protein product [Adineta steineri]
MLHYHTDATVLYEKMIPIEQQQQHRECSLSPDSLEQRLLKHHLISDDGVGGDEDESFLSSSPSLADSISINQQCHTNSTKTFRKTLTYHGLHNNQSFFTNENINNDDDDEEDDDMDDDLDEIHIDQDDVNLLFSDPDDGLLCRLSGELIDVDDDYDDENDDYCRHIRSLPIVMPSDFVISSSLSFQDQQQQQYFPYHLLDPISEAASEDERRAAISIIRQPHKYKHSSSSSLSISANGNYDGDTTTNDDLSTLSDIDEQDSSMNENFFSQRPLIFYDQQPPPQQQHIHKKRRHTEIHTMHISTKEGPIDSAGAADDTLERLRNITKMFAKPTDEDERQNLQKVERVAPSDKMKNTFQKFADIASSNGQNEEEEDENETSESDGIVRSSRKKKTPREHVPYHEMAEVKDKFEKGVVDEKPRAEKRLDVRVQSGLASSKKQAFEHGEYEQEVESHISKVQIDADLVAGLASSKKQAFEQHLTENETNQTKTVHIDHDVLAGAAADKKAKFEKGEYDQDYHDLGSNRVQADADLLVGATTDKKAKFESGHMNDSTTTSTRRDEALNSVESGNAQARRSELLSKIDAEQQTQRSGDRHIDIDTEHGLATARREQLASLANTEYKSSEKNFDVTSGLASTIKEQYMADTSKVSTTKTAQPVTVESGLAKSRATAFENPDEATIKRTVEIDNELLERGVAKERVAMFKNLQSGTQPTASAGDSKIRVDENGNIVRETDKREEIYFEKGQTKNLVEQWKTKQITPERDTPDAQVLRDAEILQQGNAKNIVEMWKTMDKENTPPPERRGPRAITPPLDNERRLSMPDDDDSTSRKPGYADDKANIESGHARAVRERLMQTAEQSNATSARKTLKQITPPPEGVRRKSITSPDTTSISNAITEQYNNNEEIVPTKGQAQSLKNRFAEYEKDALKVETASAKIKITPKRFVDTPAPKQVSVEPAVDPNKCSVCNKTVYAMEKIEADKKVYHKACFKCMHCKSILKLGNYTANDGQIYCKPHFLQLFAIKGNYSAGFGLNDHKARWLPNSSSSSSPSSISYTHESTSFNES